jgi:hypothetical protein
MGTNPEETCGVCKNFYSTEAWTGFGRCLLFRVSTRDLNVCDHVDPVEDS